MKFGIPFYFGGDNYGDDIQSVAAMDLFDKVDFFLNRENLSNPEYFDTIKFICNGWFMHNPDKWPPATNLIPLFISFHVTNWNDSYKKLINKNLYNYYKKYEPIGCRDLYTLNLFKKINIKAYFSGCVTLTLENKYNENQRTNEILLIDPIFDYFDEDFRNKIIDKLIPGSIKPNVKFISHYHKEKISIPESINKARKIIDNISKAHLIVTSRIHAALPAIALGTPVLFLDIGFNQPALRSRFDGLIELFNTVDHQNISFTDNSYLSLIYRKLKFYNFYFPIKEIKFDWDNPPKPPESIKDISYSIKKTVNEFIKQ